MPRAEITQELRETIKDFRIKNGIPSKILAEHINKSPAYVSKLEKGDINSIDIKELSSILRFITKENSNTKSAEQIYLSLKLKYSPKEIDEQLWFRNYDTIERLIPIPHELLEYINNELVNNSISRSYLNIRINSNEALSKDEISDTSKPENIWYSVPYGNSFKSNIKIHFPLDSMEDILDGKTESSRYMFIFCIVFYIQKIIKYNEKVIISDDDYNLLYQNTTNILNSYKFYSISERNILYNAEIKKANQELEGLLNSFSQQNSHYITEILKQFMLASDYNLTNTNQQLCHFNENLHWDLGFMLALISLDFSKLNNVNVRNKKELLKEIKKLVDKYNELPSNQNLIEDYSKI